MQSNALQGNEYIDNFVSRFPGKTYEESDLFFFSELSGLIFSSPNPKLLSSLFPLDGIRINFFFFEQNDVFYIDMKINSAPELSERYRTFLYIGQNISSAYHGGTRFIYPLYLKNRNYGEWEIVGQVTIVEWISNEQFDVEYTILAVFWDFRNPSNSFTARIFSIEYPIQKDVYEK
jgi:hypothetical protein